MEVACSFHTASNFHDHIFKVINEITPNKVWMGSLIGKNDQCSHAVLMKCLAVPKSKWRAFEDHINALKNRSKLVAHVCAFRGVFEYKEDLLVVRDWYKTTLQDEIKGLTQGLDLERILRYGTHITRGVSELHESGIVSMDIKPQNVLIDEKDIVFLTDFGLGDILKSFEISIEDNIGPKYAAPEKWKYFNESGPSSTLEALDAWSFGCTLLEMSTSYFLWKDLSETEIQEYVNQKELPIDLKYLLEGALLDIIGACLNFESHKRPAFAEMKKKFICNVDNLFVRSAHPIIIKTNKAPVYLVKCLHEHIKKNDEARVMSILKNAKEDGQLDYLLNEKHDGFCSVLLACNLGFHKCLKVLFGFGANSNVTDGEGQSIIHITVGRNFDECALLILKNGGSLGTKNSQGKTPLHLCIEMENATLVQKILNIPSEGLEGSLNIPGPLGTPLTIAATLKNEVALKLVELLLAKGADRNGRDHKGQTALHIAVKNCNADLAKILLQGERKGAVNVKDIHNNTPLHVALCNDTQDCAVLLLKNGADCTLENDDGDNAFHLAAQASIINSEYLVLIEDMLSCTFSQTAARQASITSATHAFNAKNYRQGWKPHDFLKMVPQSWISQHLSNPLILKEIDVSIKREDPRKVLIHKLEETEHRNLDDAKKAGLEDANHAGGTESSKCTLIITEGESAKQFAKSGIDMHLGRDKFGVYPLTGKILNMNGKNEESVLSNQQVQDIFCALGLKRTTAISHKSDYKCLGYSCMDDDIKNLRYGHIMIMTDQDSDGAHIKGLIINMFYCLCPNLLKIPIFISDFTTYLIKATNKMTNKIESFKLLNDYESWTATIVPSEWSIEYYKGLASNVEADVGSYFLDHAEHRRYFLWAGEIDANYMDIAFNCKLANERKSWIYDYDMRRGRSPYSSKVISYGDFLRREMIMYFIDNNRRSLSSIMDGFKPSQRKVMYFLLEKDEKPEVAKLIDSLAGMIIRSSFYPHRISALSDTIAQMAHHCNINLLKAIGYKGQVNTAYTSTKILPIAHLIFRKEDSPILARLTHNGEQMEPQWYAPIIPMVLINGCGGIGCGFSSKVPCFNPKDIIANLRRLMDGYQVEELRPWYPQKKGHVEKNNNNTYTIYGHWELQSKENDNVLLIDELPPGTSYQTYETFLDNLKMKNSDIKDVEKSTLGNHFIVKLKKSLDDSQLKKTFRLGKVVSTSSMYLFNARGSLVHYRSPEKVLCYFFKERLNLYEKRKECQDAMETLEHSLDNSDISEQKRKIAMELWRKELQALEDGLNAQNNDEIVASYKDHADLAVAE